MSFCLVTETFNLLQKPGGIISLLDEAWYAAIIYVCLLFSASIFDHVIIEFLLGFLDSFHVYVPLPSVVDELTLTHFCLVVSCSMFPKSTHETFAQKLYQTFKNNKRFIKPKLSRTDFTISHYAGEVNTSHLCQMRCLLSFSFSSNGVSGAW